jgi:Carboxypeptidase regulatory-like domain
MKMTCNKNVATPSSMSNRSRGYAFEANRIVDALSGTTIKQPFVKIVAVLWLTILFLGKSAGATNGGSISGTVTDRSGAVIANANVIVRDVDRRMERSTSTNDAGFYAFTFLPVGRYEIAIRSPGFRPYVRTGLSPNRCPIATKTIDSLARTNSAFSACVGLSAAVSIRE